MKSIIDLNLVDTINRDAPFFLSQNEIGQQTNQTFTIKFDIPTSDYNIIIKIIAKIVKNNEEDFVTYPYIYVLLIQYRGFFCSSISTEYHL